MASPDTTCPICLEPLTTPLKTPCNHIFCQSCLSAHFGALTTCRCPICRRDIIWRDVQPDRGGRGTSSASGRIYDDDDDEEGEEWDEDLDRAIAASLADEYYNSPADDDDDDEDVGDGRESFASPPALARRSVVLSARARPSAEWASFDMPGMEFVGDSQYSSSIGRPPTPRPGVIRSHLQSSSSDGPVNDGSGRGRHVSASGAAAGMARNDSTGMRLVGSSIRRDDTPGPGVIRRNSRSSLSDDPVNDESDDGDDDGDDTTSSSDTNSLSWHSDDTSDYRRSLSRRRATPLQDPLLILTLARARRDRGLILEGARFSQAVKDQAREHWETIEEQVRDLERGVDGREVIRAKDELIRLLAERLGDLRARGR